MDTANNYVLPEFGFKDMQIAKGEVIETCRNSKHPSSLGGRALFGLSQLDR